MKIVSFNVNGIRARIHQLEALINKHQPDVIGLQEIKVQNDLYPVDVIRNLGYESAIHGQKSHYGVAMLTRLPVRDLECAFPGESEDAQRRMIRLTLDYKGKPLTVFNGYFPQGESRNHPEKFPNKEAFYANLTRDLHERYSPEDQVVVMGDMNISPQDIDIGIGDENRKRWLRTGKCSFLPEEREWYDTLINWGLSDAWRQHYPEENNIFSWFDYRSKGFNDTPKRGLRIDHMLITAPLQKHNAGVEIDYDIRAMEKPSDHCPVVLQLD